MKKWVIGIDEAGRGPLAGPVAVGVSAVCEDFDWDLLPGVTDSKKLSEAKRGEIFVAARQLQASYPGQLDFAVSMVSAAVIDRIGIVPAINLAMGRALQKIENGRTAIRMTVKLDGGLVAPKQFINQETIIKGDSKEKVIGLASIMAKVTRDRYMVRKGALPLFAPYTLATHKGYGTKAHRHAIAKHGLSKLHRSSYCKNIKLL